jgi:hypothetical protein
VVGGKANSIRQNAVENASRLLHVGLEQCMPVSKHSTEPCLDCSHAQHRNAEGALGGAEGGGGRATLLVALREKRQDGWHRATTSGRLSEVGKFAIKVRHLLLKTSQLRPVTSFSLNGVDRQRNGAFDIARAKDLAPQMVANGPIRDEQIGHEAVTTCRRTAVPVGSAHVSKDATSA